MSEVPAGGTRLGDAGARIILDGFDAGRHAFAALTARAQERFERREWREGQQDSVARLALYEGFVARVDVALEALFGDRDAARAAWPAVRDAFLRQAEGRGDADLALTFFSSAARRFFGTVGVDPDIEFLQAIDGAAPASTVARHVPHRGSIDTLVRDVLAVAAFTVAWDDLDRDSALAADRIRRLVDPASVAGAEVVDAVFYRNTSAFVVGRILRQGAPPVPLVLALRHDDGAGVTVDAVLLTEDEVSVVFSYTRSYFSVMAPSPKALVDFLQMVLPNKPIADLYIAIGHHKRGKTELYRALLERQRTTTELFDFVPGAHGMVMIVFALPGAEQVFKIIRDRFAYPKSITREGVMAKYQLVFEHDRAGRLVDAQEFLSLAFDRRRFEPRLLEELATQARQSVEVGGERLLLRHVYTERRVTPLDVYLRSAPMDDAVRAVLDYGAAVRDLASTNIFPGDLLLKNFGVTRHGRVVFYDYDEILLLTDCRFRRMPEARDDIEAYSEQPWFSVSEGDVFPEEFGAFLGLTGVLREAFMARHGDLLDVEFWRERQEAIRAGAVIDFFPYSPDHRLRHAPQAVS
ncbi:MAG: bifunctional isocitrate dehydrogenase kinase/phosphatase [Vicinamibacterales bacterium]